MARLDLQISQVNLMLDSLLAIQTDTVSQPSEQERISPEIIALRRQLADMHAERERQLQEDEANSRRLREQQSNQKLSSIQTELTALREAVDQLRAAVQSSLPTTTIPEDDLLSRKIAGQERQIIYFDTGTTDLSPPAKNTLAHIADLLKLHDRLYIRLSGFADASGNPARNRELADQRAAAVKDYLLQEGIAAARIEVAPGRIDANIRPPALGRRTEVALYIRE